MSTEAELAKSDDRFGWTYGSEEKDVNEKIAEGIRMQLEGKEIHGIAIMGLNGCSREKSFGEKEWTEYTE